VSSNKCGLLRSLSALGHNLGAVFFFFFLNQRTACLIVLKGDLAFMGEGYERRDGIVGYSGLLGHENESYKNLLTERNEGCPESPCHN